MLEAVQNFLNHYTDEAKIECVANGRIASIAREDILSIKNVKDAVLVSFDDYLEELPDNSKISFSDIRVTSDVSIFKD